ncbi:MAG: ABC transporter ATP-binding protein [Chloroflexota bacterium]
MIRIQQLRKRYGRTTALDGLNLTVPDGAIYGFIGQNGAGKTTTLRILATLMLPDGGEVEVAGIDIFRYPHRVRKIMGYMPDFFGVYDDLKVGEYLEFYASLHGLRGTAAVALRDNLLELVDLGHKRDDYVEALSRGMQQRLCLARALVHDPQLLLLDEPASGLDPVARVEMRELLKELGRMGKTILISSHILSELADLCTHIGVIAAGKLVREGTVKELLWAAEQPSYLLHPLKDTERTVTILERLNSVGGIEVEDGQIRFHCEGGAEGAAAVLSAVVAEGIPIIKFMELENSLETAFLELTRNGG